MNTTQPYLNQLDVAQVVDATGVDIRYLYSVANAPEKYYRVFQQPKSNGGQRTIMEPLPLLKSVQRWLLDSVLYKLPVHQSAWAYVPGRSIKRAARLHLRQPHLYQTDLRDFFENVRRSDVYKLFEIQNIGRPTSQLLTALCCLDRGVAQGAPTSGALSNLILHAADERMFQFARTKGYRYTRYSDDITISGKNLEIDECRHMIVNVFGSFGHRVNWKKSKEVKTDRDRALVLGVVVNEKLNVPREYYKKFRMDFFFLEKFGPDRQAERGGFRYTEQYLRHMIGRAHYIMKVRSTDEYVASALIKLKSLYQSEKQRSTISYEASPSAPPSSRPDRSS